MGSLVFLGQDLNGTPYSDLSLKGSTVTADVDNTNTKTQLASTGGVSLPILPFVSLCTDEEGVEAEASVEMTAAGDGTVNNVATSPLNAFVRAAHLFGTVACAQLSLSSIDPLRTAFASGLQVLPKLHKLQRAFAWLTNYAPGNSDGTHTLPVSQLYSFDPSAHSDFTVWISTSLAFLHAFWSLVSVNNLPISVFASFGLSLGLSEARL